MPAKEPAAPAVESPKEPKTFTNWKAFEQARLTPVIVKCDGYKPVHLADISCHTQLHPKAEAVKRHVDGDHGGGFMFQLKVKDPGDKTPSPFWNELAEAGLEAHDFRCDNCDRQLRFHPSAIIPHMKAHGGKTRRVYPGGRFNLTLSLAKPEYALLDEDESAS